MGDADPGTCTSTLWVKWETLGAHVFSCLCFLGVAQCCLRESMVFGSCKEGHYGAWRQEAGAPATSFVHRLRRSPRRGDADSQGCHDGVVGWIGVDGKAAGRTSEEGTSKVHMGGLGRSPRPTFPASAMMRLSPPPRVDCPPGGDGVRGKGWGEDRFFTPGGSSFATERMNSRRGVCIAKGLRGEVSPGRIR